MVGRTLVPSCKDLASGVISFLFLSIFRVFSADELGEIVVMDKQFLLFF